MGMNKPKFSQLAQGLGFDVSDNKDDVDDYYGNAKMSMRQPTKNRFIGLGMDRNRNRNKFRGQHKPRPRPYTQPERHNPNDPDYIEQQEPNRFQQHNRRKEPPRNRFEEPPNRNRKRYQDEWFENHKDSEEWDRPQELGMDKDHQDHKEGRRDRDRPRKDAMTKTKVEYNNPHSGLWSWQHEAQGATSFATKTKLWRWWSSPTNAQENERNATLWRSRRQTGTTTISWTFQHISQTAVDRH